MDLPGARLADDERRGAGLQPPAQHPVERGDAGLDQLGERRLGGEARHDPGIDLDAGPGPDREVVVAVGEGDAAHLLHLDAPPRQPVFRQLLLQADDAVRQALELQVAAEGAAGVDQHGGDAAVGDVGLEAEQLAPVARGIRGEVADLEQAVVDDAPGAVAGDRLLDRDAGAVQPDVGGLEDGLVAHPLEGVLRVQLLDHEAVERPAMRGGDLGEFGARLGEADIEHGLSPPQPGAQELQPEGGLAGAGRTLHEIDARPGQPAAEDLVEAGDARGERPAGPGHGARPVRHGLSFPNRRPRPPARGPWRARGGAACPPPRRAASHEAAPQCLSWPDCAAVFCGGRGRTETRPAAQVRP